MPPLPRPCLALIADGFSKPERASRAQAAVRSGIRWVHLRDHSVGPDAFDAAARALAQRLRTIAPDVVLSVNTHMDTASDLGAGLHVGRRGPAPDVARRLLHNDILMGYSAHGDVEATRARIRAVDYFFFSPVFPTSSKPDHPGAGLPALRSFCQAAQPAPVVALGGITPERVSACRRAGAWGVAVLSGIMDAETPGAATRAYIRALGAPAR